MNYHTHTFLFKLRFIFVGMLMLVSFIVLMFLISYGMTNSSVQAKSSDVSSSSTAEDRYDSPNVITNSMLGAADTAGHSIDVAMLRINHGIVSFASATARSSKAVGKGAKTGVTAAVRGTSSGVVFVGHTAGSGVTSVVKIPGKVLGFISKPSVVDAVLRPSEHEEVPIINPNSPKLLAAIVAMPPTKPATQKTTQPIVGPAWPIHGAVTTEFGVYHLPYQPTHTGIDISDTRIPGITPVKPFRPGRVVDTVVSNYGLGNHVTVDHGNGITSVYGHLASISVKIGQDIDMTTVIGMEGSTGVSTGTHLHFEIRVNGQVANPHQFISGQP